tara:strand:- start:372 stop:569 length:198 start_codon:yes stop_codon:yes gene_type:complete
LIGEEKVIKYILATLLFGTICHCTEYNYTKPTPTIVVNEDGEDTYASRKRGKKGKGRRKGGWGLR